MTPRYLLDTNILSELAKRIPDAGVEQRVFTEQAHCAIAAPTVEELAYGIARLPASGRREMLDKWLDGVLMGFVQLPFDTACALWLGRERARLAATGTPAPRTDGEIAAIAAVNDLTLVTRNLSDFTCFQGLRLENWFAG